LPLNDEVFTSLLLLLFSVSDGIVSPTLIWAFIENEYNMSTVI
jgi:hypothetical protein